MANIQMKNSGIDWIGEIPAHWEVKRVKDVSIVSTGQTPPREQAECFSNKKENNYLWIKPEDLNSFGKISETKEYITKYGLNFIKLYDEKSLILSGIGAGLGNIGISKYKFTTNQQNHILSKHKNFKYLFYFMFAAKEHIKSLSVGNVLSILNATKLKNSFIINPTIEEQKSIVSYLDIETSKIDRKISILEQKYEKLEEYKQSVIFETVTKGLDSNVEMKDSEIDWISEIPKHWNIKRVKEVAKWQTGFTPDTKKSEYYDGNDDWITIGDMNGKYIKSSKNKINGNLFPKYWITPANSLLFSFKLSIGQVAFNEKEIFTNEAICSFSPKSKINLNYFYYAAPIFICKNAKKNIYNADLLNQDLIANANCLIPTEKEQKEIVVYLDNLCSKLNKKLEIIKKQIELLKEYKQTIIYEAVTGKMEIL